MNTLATLYPHQYFKIQSQEWENAVNLKTNNARAFSANYNFLTYINGMLAIYSQLGHETTLLSSNITKAQAKCLEGCLAEKRKSLRVAAQRLMSNFWKHMIHTKNAESLLKVYTDTAMASSKQNASDLAYICLMSTLWSYAALNSSNYPLLVSQIRDERFSSLLKQYLANLLAQKSLPSFFKVYGCICFALN